MVLKNGDLLEYLYLLLLFNSLEDILVLLKALKISNHHYILKEELLNQQEIQ